MIAVTPRIAVFAQGLFHKPGPILLEKTVQPAVRSVILRGDNNTNRYYGEFMLVKLGAQKRTWLRIATEVELE